MADYARISYYDRACWLILDACKDAGYYACNIDQDPRTSIWTVTAKHRSHNVRVLLGTGKTYPECFAEVTEYLE